VLEDSLIERVPFRARGASVSGGPKMATLDGVRMSWAQAAGRRNVGDWQQWGGNFSKTAAGSGALLNGGPQQVAVAGVAG
jgi:hypothetical protein